MPNNSWLYGIRIRKKARRFVALKQIIHPNSLNKMASVNKVILVGHLGKDPETRNFENGGSICSFPLATKESYFDREKNQRVEQETDWHNIRIGKTGLAKVAQQYLHKGSQVYLEGVIRYRTYQTKEGETKYITEIHVEEMVLLGSRPNTEVGGGRSEETPAPVPQPVATDDLPF
jgi:single-strand DNA-binding protein